MSNVIKKSMMPGRCSKPIYVVHFVARVIGGIPCFTPYELTWIEKNVSEPEHLEFLWKARVEDPLYQVAPPPPVIPNPPQSESAKAAMQECMAFLKDRFPKK